MKIKKRTAGRTEILRTKLFIMFITLLITIKTNTLISKVSKTLADIESDNLLPFVDKTVTRC